MRVNVLGSSSSGNGYVITIGGESVIIECGLPPREALRAVNYQADTVKAIFVSHEHGDHAKYIDDYAFMFHCPIYTTSSLAEHHNAISVEGKCMKWQRAGDGSFLFMPFRTKHDCESYGYVIRHPSFGNIFFGTDTYAYPCVFKGIDFFLIEANYNDDLIQTLDEPRKKRLLVSHMSIAYCEKYLARCRAERAKGIMLIHLSAGNSNAKAFKDRIHRRFGVECWIADKKTTAEIDDNETTTAV